MGVKHARNVISSAMKLAQPVSDAARRISLATRKRPRGPNVRSSAVAQHAAQPHIRTGEAEASLVYTQQSFVPSGLNNPLEHHVLCYYSRYWLEVPSGWPEIVDGHLKFAVATHCFSQPQSVLSLAVLAVSHATFARARRSREAVTKGRAHYSRALVKTQMALRDKNEAIHDDVLLAVMLLSFYENSVIDNTSQPWKNITDLMTKSFAHHDGAMAMLNLRRQSEDCTERGIELDKLVRRSLLRSALLRSAQLPLWLQDGSSYGECGIALGLDRCMVKTAKLRHDARHMSLDSLSPPNSQSRARINRVLAEAQALDENLAVWAYSLRPEDQYTSHTVNEDRPNQKVFDGRIHLYPTGGHAGMWNRYRALRLTANDIILKALFLLFEQPGFDIRPLEGAATSRIELLADDLCASILFVLGLIQLDVTDEGEAVVTVKAPVALKDAVKATTASLLAWPLTMAMLVDGIPERHRRYLRDRIRDVGKIVDDGTLERIAAGVKAPPVRTAEVL
ncbi:MAG: hypothetical protein L6R40_007163 [Gallowayella cf. fulva]|nr:MAG: hypothetical protein L6R40_007163 [Xanthomendoza cf. fulva]